MLMKKFFQRFIYLYTEHRIPMSAAALSYYLTMTFFPIVICIYTMLGNSYESAMRIMDILGEVMPERTVDYVVRFLNYVRDNNSALMMVFAVSIILITASAAFRSLENTIGRMQGGRRFEGYAFFITSIFIALLFVVILYLAIIAMFFGEAFINWLNGLFPSVDISDSWLKLRFAILFAIVAVLLFLIYELCKQKTDRYNTFWGTLVATIGLDAITVFFSIFINRSVKYTTVYSSLAAIILLMFWLYCCCQIIYIGATMNVALRDVKIKKED